MHSIFKFYDHGEKALISVFIFLLAIACFSVSSVAEAQEATATDNVVVGTENPVALVVAADEDNQVAQTDFSKIKTQDEDDTEEAESGLTSAAGSSNKPSAVQEDEEEAVTQIPAKYASGWQLIGKDWYYFDAAGEAKTGWLRSGGKWYYLDPDGEGVMKTGFYQVNGVNYASFPSGAMAENQWIKIGDDWYYASSSGALKTGWLRSGGKWYYLDPETAAMETGLYQVSGVNYASFTSGAMAANQWIKIGSDWYYASGSGALKTGWLRSGGKWYYLDPDGEGIMKTGRYQAGDAWYVSNASGAMFSNKWAKVGSDWYYATGSGALKTGWHKSSGKWYWLQPDKGGLMASGDWINDGKADYFITESGAMFTGWLNQGSANGLANGMAFDIKRVLDIALAEVGYKEKASDAQLDDKTANAGSKNFTKYGRDMHAIDPGVMDYADAWCDAFVDWCFVQAYGVENARGLLGGAFNDYTPYSAQLFKDQVSWYISDPKVGDQVFFQNSTTINHTGIVYAVSKGKIYTVEGNSTNMVTKREYSISTSASKIAGYGRPLYNNMNDDGKFVAAKEWCFLSSSGARASGWVKDSGNWYYFDPTTGLMQRGKKVIDGNTYSFATSGVMKTGWAKENSKWYYYDKSGVMQKNAWIDDYYVGSDGVMATNSWIGDRYVDAAGKYDPTKKK